MAVQGLRNQGFPGANPQRNQQRQAAQNLAVKQAAAQQPVNVQNVGQMAAVGVQQAGQADVNAASKAQQAIGAMANQAVQQKQAELQTQQVDAKQGIARQGIDDATRLAQLDQNAKRDILDSRLQFQEDEAGRKLFNERQIADYVALNAKSENDLKNTMQTMEQAANREMQLLEHAHEKINQLLSNEYEMRKQGLDQAQRKRLTEMKIRMEEEMRRKQAKAANRSSMLATLGTVGGAVIGGYMTAGTPMGASGGAMVGAQVGGGLSSALGGI